MRKLLLRAVFALSFVITLSSSKRLSIVGGGKSDIKGFPYQGAYLASKKLKCGACIISEWCALTAGHCAADYNKNITLRVGSTRKDKGGQLIEVEKLVIHPKFEHAKYSYDFAIMKLKEKIIFDENCHPIGLPKENQKIPDDLECSVSGWGMNEKSEKPRELQSVKVSTVNSATCQKNYNTSRVRFKINESMLCAGVHEGGKDACSGDSGGPLECDGLLLGTVSSGLGCGLKDFPGIYGRVSKVVKWIQEVCHIPTN